MNMQEREREASNEVELGSFINHLKLLRFTAKCPCILSILFHLVINYNYKHSVTHSRFVNQKRNWEEYHFKMDLDLGKIPSQEPYNSSTS